MSRYQLSIDDYPHKAEKVAAVLAYGFDHVAGYFYQVYVPSEQAPIEDRDSWRGLSRHELLERFDALAVAIPDAHRSAIVLDLPF